MITEALFEKSEKGKSKKKVKPLDLSKIESDGNFKKVIRTKVVDKKVIKVAKKENIPNRFDSQGSKSPFSPIPKTPKFTESVLRSTMTSKVIRPTTSASAIKKTPVTPIKKV